VLDFTAIDLEKASSLPGSVCSVGVVRVRDGEIVDRAGGLVRPPEGLDQAFGFWAADREVTREMMAAAPPWRKIAAWIAEYAGSDTLVAHNEAYRVGLLMRSACMAAQVPWPEASTLCTMLLSRRAFRLPSYRLPFVAVECGVSMSGRHPVLINARATALVAVALARRHDAGTLAELAETLQVRPGRVASNGYEPCAKMPAARSAAFRESSKATLVTPEVNPRADPDHPFYGRVIVFTGRLESRTRQQAWDDVAKLGGIPERSVTRSTNILVIGDLDPSRLIPGAPTSTKATRAFALHAQGQDIEVMTEEDFLEHL
jgi:DNA polymerase III subunit epsilon